MVSAQLAFEFPWRRAMGNSKTTTHCYLFSFIQNRPFIHRNRHTLNVYSHTIPSMQHEAAEAIEKALCG